MSFLARRNCGIETALSNGIVQPSGVTGLVAWYEADPANVTIDGSNRVSQWDDLSGNDYHLTQATEANRPIFNATSGPGGLGELQFDGTNHWMANTSFTDFPDQATVHGVFDMEAGDASQLVYEITSSTGGLNTGIQQLHDSGNTINRVKDASAKSVTVSESLPITAHISSFIYDGAITNTLKLYRNGSQVGSTQTSVGTLTNTLARLYIGKTTTVNYLLKGGISALVIYNAALSDTDRQNIEAYLNNKYALY